MTVEEKKAKFIETWGTLGPKWGINKTMAHIHALLIFQCQPLCADEIMEHLQISRGNVHTNLRCLQSWELIQGVNIEGDRKEYFIAEKDMWQIFSIIIRKRKEQELCPLRAMLDELSSCDNCNSDDEKKFHHTIKEMKVFADKADGMLENLVNSEKSWIMKGFKIMMR